MIGDTLTVTYNSVAKVLNKINQDNYTSEFYLRDALEDYRVKVRHSTESVKAGQPVYERHQVDLTRTVFATTTTPERIYQTYTVIRLQKGADPDAAELLASALCGVLSASFVDKVVGWQS
jgi:bifunctional N-acetylglucosamine-1-phosphate-uridyltransferase/glucosamine-1-phosphate-acetyltransferase GlmU-like protein